MYRKNKGFTLIELLVVIAIIAVLAAILFPVFARAREQARASSCLSNVKQLGTAFMMYLQDNDGAFPVGYAEAANANADGSMEIYTGHGGGDVNYMSQCSFRAQLDPYVKNARVFICPSDSGVPSAYQAGKRFTSYHYRWYFTGGTNPAFGAPGWSGPFKENDFPKIANVFVLSEILPFHDMRTLPAYGLDWWHWPTDVKENMLFGDCHAKMMPMGKVMMESSPNLFDMHWPKHLWDGDPPNGAYNFWYGNGSKVLIDLDD